ncbi:hypothetical protein PybrP1_006354 [[Pythium] brassicae (nom. inval.)]|nr:hypothetical protein PybrP1_006354 [[Pythium] brassicae (nom. inval.)]
MKQLQQQRLQQIQREIDCALALRGRGIDANHLPADTSIAAICALVRRLREMEKSQEFHRNLLRAQREISAGSVYTLDNFAYGSTPFPTWLQIVSADSVRSAIAALRSSCANRWRCTVFGSSTGSLVFYAALALGVDCVGVEILPFLYNVSTKLRDEIVPAEVRMRCEFVCEDMLQTPLGTTSLLILTSQCWDNDLHKQVARKLERELPAGAAVVDYKDSLRRSSSFRLEERLEGLPVSWAHKQPLYVFRKCPR